MSLKLSRKKYTIPVLSFIFCFIFSATTSYATLVDRVVAIVNDEIITLSELEETGKEFLAKVQSESSGAERPQALQGAKEAILNQLITQKLINQQAELANVRVAEREFEMAYKQLRGKSKLSDDDFRRNLKRQGLTEENYKSNFRSKLLRDKLILYEVRSKIIITEEMMTDYYNNEFSEQLEGGGYYILHLGIAWDNAQEKSQARAKAESLRQQIVDGADFRTIAKKHSSLPTANDGGDLGVFQEEDMAPFMKKAILPLKANELSQVIERNRSFEFFQLISKKEGEVTHSVPYFSVKEEIRKKLFEQKFKEEYQRWVEAMKSRSYIKKMLY